MKQCNDCLIFKNLSEFYKDVTCSQGVKNRCKRCQSSIDSKRFLNRRDIHKAQQRIYDANNRDKNVARTAKKKAKRIKRYPKWLSELDKFIINEIYNLAKLRTSLLCVEFEVDHILPLQGRFVSGLHHPLNLQIITKSFNRSKSNNFNIEECIQ